MNLVITGFTPSASISTRIASLRFIFVLSVHKLLSSVDRGFEILVGPIITLLDHRHFHINFLSLSDEAYEVEMQLQNSAMYLGE